MPVYQVIFTVLPINMGVILVYNGKFMPEGSTPHKHGGDSN